MEDETVPGRRMRPAKRTASDPDTTREKREKANDNDDDDGVSEEVEVAQ